MRAKGRADDARIWRGRARKSKALSKLDARGLTKGAAQLTGSICERENPQSRDGWISWFPRRETLARAALFSREGLLRAATTPHIDSNESLNLEGSLVLGSGILRPCIPTRDLTKEASR